MEDNKEQLQTAESATSNVEATNTISTTATDSKENDSTVEMSVASPAPVTNSDETNVAVAASSASSPAAQETKQNLINLTIKTPKEKESVVTHADATVKEVKFRKFSPFLKLLGFTLLSS